MALNDVYRLAVNQVCAGKDTVNLFYYYESTPATNDEQVTAFYICNQFYNDIWLPKWKPILSNFTSLTYLFCNRVYPTANDGQGIPMESEAGLVSQDSLPNGSCGLLSFKANLNVQNFWRRSYISGLPESDCLVGFLTPPAVNRLEQLADAIVNTDLNLLGFGGGIQSPCAFSKKRVADATSPVFSPLKTYKVTKGIKSQRQRNPAIV